MTQIILASKSPRRKALLKQIGLEFTIIPSTVKETLNPRLKPRGQAENLSELKAVAVYKNYKQKTNTDFIIIAADTIIALDQEVMGKPKNISDAKIMLRKLSGRKHQVITAFTIIDSKSNKKITKSEITYVHFRKIQSREINRYVSSEKLTDKAGAYAIQGKAAVFVEKIEGDYTNIVGLPLFAMSKELHKFGITIL